MFTGLIQSLGIVKDLGQDRFSIEIAPNKGFELVSDLELGDSVAVDGVCLTVETILESGFVATASPETLKRTTLGHEARRSPWVNLETSLRVGSKIGGHFVTGHVDSIGCLEQSVRTAQAWEMWFSYPPASEDTWRSNIAPCLVPKGSVAVNGISLTIAECDRQGNKFKVAVIPVTYAETNLAYLQAGSWVNVEGDILGKYVQRFIQYQQPASVPAVDQEFLAEHGYL